MIRRPTAGSRIHVVWEDCFTVDGWTTSEELLARKPWTVDVLGWFLGRTKQKSWVVASGVTPSEDGGAINGGGTWLIPESLIRSWETIQ